MNKSTLYGKEARAKILEGVKKITNAIKVTLGSNGRNVIIAQGMVIDYNFHNMPLHITKDGWTVARCFNVEDPLERVGVMMIKEVCTKTVDMAGDGTTTSAVLAEAIVTKGIELIDNGANPMELKKGIDKAVEYVVEQLKKIAIPIGDDNEKIFQVATVSANNDAVIGRLIADAFAKIGNEGVIDIEESAGVNTEIKTTDGFKIDSGWESVSPLFVNNKEKQICEFENPLILLYSNRITHHTQFEKALETAMKNGGGRPIIIVCEDAAEEGLAVLVRNNFEGRIRCCVVKSPYFGDAKREAMEDLATATGGFYISDSKGFGIKDVDNIAHFGKAKKVIVSKYETVFIGGNYNAKDYDELVADLKMNKTQAESEDEKNKIEKRIARLTGGVAVIHVGATTETEMKEKKDRVDDAIRATKAAISEGFVVGGGTAFLKIIQCRHPKKTDFGEGFDLIMSILSEPTKQICLNAGVNADDIIKQVDDMNRMQGGNNMGYNAKSDTIEDLIESGIIDPVKVLRCALQNAASSAGMILTAEVMIVDTL